MDIKEKIDNLSEAEAKAGLLFLWNVANVECVFCTARRKCGVEVSRNSEKCLENIIMEAKDTRNGLERAN